jgi:hypothetical protein
MYIKIIEGEPTPYSISRLKADNPNISFPRSITEDMLREYDVYPVTVQTNPEINTDTHYSKQSEFYQVDDKWFVQYYPEQLPLNQAEKNIREKRNKILTESDWIIVSSYEQQVSVPEIWIEYRQNLRDLPQQDGFPYDVTWPESPLGPNQGI